MKIMTLSTQRLDLQDYCVQDQDHFVRLNTNSVVREKMDGPLTSEAATQLFQKILSENRMCWAIKQKKQPLYIGHCFLDQTPEAKTVEIGFLFLPDYWGQGFATEVTKVLTEFALQKGYTKIIATVDDDHIPSIRVLEKTGFLKEKTVTDEEGIYLVYSMVRDQ
jgi:RimJ/RimL family protein N-acetyltransferase